MKLKFVWVGSTRDRSLRRLEDTYLNRIESLCRIERISIPETRKTDPRQIAAQMERESKALEARIGKGTFLVSLDERGAQLSSEELAAFLENLMIQGVSEITFVVGGHLGIPERIRNSANKTLSLSRMTLPHELSRVVLVEQIYRALSIVKNLPYHK